MRNRLPVKLKLAVVSAALTFAILLLFALVVGAFTERRLHAGFEDDLRATAADLRDQITARPTPGGGSILRVPETLYDTASAGGAVIRVFERDGSLIGGTPGPRLGPPIEAVLEVRNYRVVTRPIFSGQLRGADETSPFEPPGSEIDEAVAGYVQYAKPESSVNRTVSRVRAFLALGVLGGTLLAFLAGFLVARRAMRPIAGLTRAARQVARTRDPAGVHLPKPQAHDEVAELAETLEEMLEGLSHARTESEAALARQRAFVADASHELRTPLTSILANLELLSADLEGEDAEIARSALRSSQRMRRLVADLLLLARADAGRAAPRKAVDLARVVREVAGEAAPLAGERTLELDLAAPGRAMVEAAPDDIHRLALNLVENAYTHTPVDSHVCVSVSCANGEAVLVVRDDGPGIAAEMRARIFERFSRGGGDTTPAISGSGLGLAIVQSVAEGHGGTVAIDEPPGGGARFTVRLPASGAGEPLPASTRVAALGD